MRRLPVILILLAVGCPARSRAAEPECVPVPDTAAQAEGKRKVREVFKTDLAKDDPADLSALAAKLLRLAGETGDSPAYRHALISEAIVAAARARDVKMTLRAVDELTRRFEVDGIVAALDALGAIGAKDTPEKRALAAAYLQVAWQAFSFDRYTIALKAADKASQAAVRLKGLGEKAADLKKDIGVVAGEFERIKDRRAVLEKQPDDAAANLDVGRFYCLFKGDWARGMPLLAKGGREGKAPLAIQAEMDLAGPRSGADMLVVADGWWWLAGKSDGMPKRRLLERAACWYERALPEIGGIQRIDVEKRLAEIWKDQPEEIPDGAVLMLTFEARTMLAKGGKVFARNLGSAGGSFVVVDAKRTPGRAGECLSFDGKTTHVDCGPFPYLKGEVFTLSVWVRSPSFQGAAMDSIISKDQWSRGDVGFILRCVEGGRVNFNVGYGRWNDVNGPTLGKDTWYHLAAMYDRQTIQVFVDGVLAGTRQLDKPMVPAGVNLWIGCSAFARERAFQGNIDEVAIFDRALSVEEIQALYRRGRKGQPLES